MKGVSQAINDFIAEFELSITERGVCFHAVLFIYTQYLAAQVQSEVHIVSIGNDHIATIHILNPSLGIEGFPAFFESGYVDISYQQKKGLIIRATDKNYGQYKLIIHPVSSDCNEATIQEIKARYYN